MRQHFVHNQFYHPADACEWLNSLRGWPINDREYIERIHYIDVVSHANEVHVIACADVAPIPEAILEAADAEQ